MLEFQFFKVDPDFFGLKSRAKSLYQSLQDVMVTELHLLHGLLPLDGAARGEHHRGACFGQAQRGLAAQALRGTWRIRGEY